MKKMMLKDFILYNSPCINCNSNISITFNVIESGFETCGRINCVVSPEYTEIDLKISYKESLNLKVFHKTNIFETNDLQKLFRYMSRHTVFLSSTCLKCSSNIESTRFSLNINTFRAEPICVAYENISIENKPYIYAVNTSFFKNESIVTIMKKYPVKGSVPVVENVLTLPAFSLSKIKNKEKFFNKIKTYILFS
jgi:hypothetical protein